MSNIELLTNAQFGAILGSGNKSLQVEDLLTGITYNVSFAGPRGDHYDVTPTTPADIEKMQKANSGNLDWVARPVAVKIGNRRIAAGQNTFMHHIRIGGGNPGPNFPSRNENGPPWTKWGGHCCLYFSNSVGGAGGEDSTNRHARAEANQRANTPRARGRQARAACHEAHIRGGASPAPSPTPVEVNYQVEVISGPVNIRKGPGTNHAAVGQVRNPRRLRIDREQVGVDGSTTSVWGRITDEQEFVGHWIALRLTNRVADPPVSPPQPDPPLGNNIYVVDRGDTLIRIGTKTGHRWQEIARINGLSDPYTILIGQVLVLP